MEQEWMGFANKVLELLVIFMVTVLLPYGLKITKDWVEAQKARAEAALSEEQRRVIAVVIENAVRAAEQLGYLNKIENKKKEALSLAQKWLRQKGIILDIYDISALIEAEVQKLFGEKE